MEVSTLTGGGEERKGVVEWSGVRERALTPVASLTLRERLTSLG